MNADFIAAIDAIEKERGISKEVLLEAIEMALSAGYKRDFNSTQDVRIEINSDTGDMAIFAHKNIVEEVVDPNNEISVEEANKKNPAMNYSVDDIYEFGITPDAFGRIAAQTAKQVVVQKIREAERNMIYEEYSDKINEIMTAIVQRVERRNVMVKIGKTEGYMPMSEQMRGENYYINDRIKVYVVDVRNTPKGAQIIVSRSHPGLVKHLFELEVPEIKDGTVQIVHIAREAGQRTKMAVISLDESVDPIGACVGQKGSRVDQVVSELRGEKIDIIAYNEDPVEFIANALNPAKVLMVRLNEEEKTAQVVVPDQQLSLAIGKEGQNARLAAKLTSWKIDIKSQTQAMQMFAEENNYEDTDDEVLEDMFFGDFVEEPPAPADDLGFDAAFDDELVAEAAAGNFEVVEDEVEEEKEVVFEYEPIVEEDNKRNAEDTDGFDADAVFNLDIDETLEDSDGEDS